MIIRSVFLILLQIISELFKLLQVRFGDICKFSRDCEAEIVYLFHVFSGNKHAKVS